jgi:hypothetical protein
VIEHLTSYFVRYYWPFAFPSCSLFLSMLSKRLHKQGKLNMQHLIFLRNKSLLNLEQNFYINSGCDNEKLLLLFSTIRCKTKYKYNGTWEITLENIFHIQSSHYRNTCQFMYNRVIWHMEMCFNTRNVYFRLPCYRDINRCFIFCLETKPINTTFLHHGCLKFGHVFY